MGLKKKITKQFGKPTGTFGRLVGWILRVKNKKRTLWTTQKLNFKPSDKLLEIGYGPGTALHMVAESLDSGFIAGIDHSETMREQASKLNKLHIESGHAEIKCGKVWDLTYPENYFDIAYGSNVHFFWKNPAVEFAHLRKFLKPGGKCVMVFQPRWAKNEDQVKAAAEKTQKEYEAAGFINIEIEYKAMKPMTCIFISGEK